MRLALLGLALVIAGCSMPSGDELRVERLSDLHRVAPFVATVHDRATIDALANKIRSLPTAQLRYCPVDWGVHYDLDFRLEGVQFLHAVAEAGGCRNIALGQGDTRSTDEAFWEALERAVGYTVGDPSFFPTPLN